jgi:tripartite-type tricarboxylate transporter receptor subunit TctC
MKRWIIAAVAAALTGPGAVPAASQWKPDRPINLIVPWAPGGATDQVTRLAASEMEAALGQKIVVVNQPGASGSIGTKNALDAPKDGYTWTAGAVQDLGVYKVLGMAPTDLGDWNLYLSVANVPVISVNPQTPYQSLGDLLKAMKEKPRTVTISTGGVASASHNAAEAITRAAGVEYRHVTYDGGNPAVVAAVAGEVNATTQLAVEQAEMIRGKRLRPLAAFSEQPLELSGFGTISSVTAALSGLKPPTSYFGIFVPKGVPAEVTATLDKIWAETIAKSTKLQAYARDRGALFAPLAGPEAATKAMPVVRANAWLLHEAGKSKVAPDTVGIAKPDA